MTGRRLSPVELRIDRALAAVRSELLRAIGTFGAFGSGHEGYAVMLEELDELWDQVKANDLEAARAEATQVAAMAVRFMIDLGGVK